MKPVLSVLEGETIYDAAWLPTMSSSDPASCLFFSTSRDNPVHIWDAFTGACQVYLHVLFKNAGAPMGGWIVDRCSPKPLTFCSTNPISPCPKRLDSQACRPCVFCNVKGHLYGV